jgi:hypothetical protein
MFVIKPEDFIGKQFGHYQLVEFLKGGGFGLVYKAEHLRLHRRSRDPRNGNPSHAP